MSSRVTSYFRALLVGEVLHREDLVGSAVLDEEAATAGGRDGGLGIGCHLRSPLTLSG
jgi:hypothetical protein